MSQLNVVNVESISVLSNLPIVQFHQHVSDVLYIGRNNSLAIRPNNLYTVGDSIKTGADMHECYYCGEESEEDEMVIVDIEIFIENWEYAHLDCSIGSFTPHPVGKPVVKDEYRVGIRVDTLRGLIENSDMFESMGPN